tara:strand:- start:804 stop:1181 length:378 start_codon:yes stop_codon:yes gene_type:complete
MKRFANFIFVFVLVNIIFTACGNEQEKNIFSEETNESSLTEIKNICDLVDIIDMMFNEANMFKEVDFNDLSELEKQKINDFKKKYTRITELAEKKFPNAEGAEECPNYKKYTISDLNNLKKLGVE